MVCWRLLYYNRYIYIVKPDHMIKKYSTKRVFLTLQGILIPGKKHQNQYGFSSEHHDLMRWLIAHWPHIGSLFSTNCGGVFWDEESRDSHGVPWRLFRVKVHHELRGCLLVPHFDLTGDASLGWELDDRLTGWFPLDFPIFGTALLCLRKVLGEIFRATCVSSIFSWKTSVFPVLYHHVSCFTGWNK